MIVDSEDDTINSKLVPGGLPFFGEIYWNIYVSVDHLKNTFKYEILISSSYCRSFIIKNKFSYDCVVTVLKLFESHYVCVMLTPLFES